MIKSALSSLPIAHRKVFLRVDANVPLIDGAIQSDFRLQALRPTLDFLLENGAFVLLTTHLGRPTQPTPDLSTKLLIPWFVQHNYPATFAPTLQDAQRLLNEHHHLVILENVRFFEGEHPENEFFAKELACLGDYYVDDAFGTLHRSDTSISLLPRLFSASKRTIGFLVEKEIQELSTLLHKPRNGYTLILGGGKVATKIPLLLHYLKKVETIVLCPAIVFTFLKALGHPVGNSLVDDEMLDICAQSIQQARATGTTIIYPVDYQIAQQDPYGPLSFTNNDEIPADTVGISLGPRSLEIVQEIIRKSSTVFYNGLMGIANQPETTLGTQKIIEAMASSPAYTVLAGGDSVAIAEQLSLAQRISFLSTGGGAALQFLSEEPLPGLVALLNE